MEGDVLMIVRPSSRNKSWIERSVPPLAGLGSRCLVVMITLHVYLGRFVWVEVSVGYMVGMTGVGE